MLIGVLIITAVAENMIATSNIFKFNPKEYAKSQCAIIFIDCITREIVIVFIILIWFILLTYVCFFSKYPNIAFLNSKNKRNIIAQIPENTIDQKINEFSVNSEKINGRISIGKIAAA